MKMNQSGTDKGTRHETGEKEPKGVDREDDKSERHEKLKNGVGMGAADKTGVAEHGVGRDGMGKKELGEFNTGRSEKVHYEHKRIPHDQD